MLHTQFTVNVDKIFTYRQVVGEFCVQQSSRVQRRRTLPTWTETLPTLRRVFRCPSRQLGSAGRHRKAAHKMGGQRSENRGIGRKPKWSKRHTIKKTGDGWMTAQATKLANAGAPAPAAPRPKARKPYAKRPAKPRAKRMKSGLVRGKITVADNG